MTIDGVTGDAETELAAQVLDIVRSSVGPTAQAEVMVEHRALELTRFANSAIHQNVADATTTVRLRLHLHGRTAAATTTVTGPGGLRALVDRVVAAARLSPPDRAWPGLTAPTPLHQSAGHPGSGERSGLDFGFDEATARATPEERAVRVREFVLAAAGLETAGYCRTGYTTAAFANSAGQSVRGHTAEAAMDGIARADGHDGAARVAAGRFADLDGAVLGARAAAKARAGRHPIELPPGCVRGGAGAGGRRRPAEQPRLLRLQRQGVAAARVLRRAGRRAVRPVGDPPRRAARQPRGAVARAAVRHRGHPPAVARARARRRDQGGHPRSRLSDRGGDAVHGSRVRGVADLGADRRQPAPRARLGGRPHDAGRSGRAHRRARPARWWPGWLVGC